MTLYFYPQLQIPDKALIIFGGSFSPIHISHMKIIEDIYQINPTCKIILVPVNDLYPKNRLIKGYNGMGINHRLHMCQRAIYHLKKDRPNWDLNVSDVTFKFNDAFADKLVFNYYRQLYPDSPIYSIMGKDVFDTLSTWKADDLPMVSNVNVIVYPRTDDISSSDIKRVYLETQNIPHVLDEIKTYIITNNLFHF